MALAVEKQFTLKGWVDGITQAGRKLDRAELNLRSRLAREINFTLSDTTLAGVGVRKSDLVVDASDFKTARILYRNYNEGLRHLKALDPAERMSVFRVRYVPFPITATAEKPAMHLMRPLRNDSPTVFEIGLSFGNDIVTGDRFFIPDFSLRRFGIAFAITQDLFSDDADVIAIALTYDFNVYGSIGVGFNFADSNAVRKYASIGINKRAFEDLAKGLLGLFGAGSN